MDTDQAEKRPFITSAFSRNLIEAMEQLNLGYEEILKTDGFSSQAICNRVLFELVKEQVPNENSDSSAS